MLPRLASARVLKCQCWCPPRRTGREAQGFAPTSAHVLKGRLCSRVGCRLLAAASTWTAHGKGLEQLWADLWGLSSC